MYWYENIINIGEEVYHGLGVIARQRQRHLFNLFDDAIDRQRNAEVLVKNEALGMDIYRGEEKIAKVSSDFRIMTSDKWTKE